MTTCQEYLDEHSACGLKVGDKVRVTRKARSKENGWDSYWVPAKNHCIGQVYEIQEDCEEAGFRLRDSHPGYKYGWCFPYFILENAEPPKQKKPRRFWNLKAVETNQNGLNKRGI